MPAGRKGFGRCDISADGSTIVFTSNSQMAGGDAPSSGDYQMWLTSDGGQTIQLISGDVNNPSDTAGISPASYCYDPAVSADGSVVARF